MKKNAKYSLENDSKYLIDKTSKRKEITEWKRKRDKEIKTHNVICDLKELEREGIEKNELSMRRRLDKRKKKEAES